MLAARLVSSPSIVLIMGGGRAGRVVDCEACSKRVMVHAHVHVHVHVHVQCTDGPRPLLKRAYVALVHAVHRIAQNDQTQGRHVLRSFRTSGIYC